MKSYLKGYHFKVITDHLALKRLNNIKNPTGRLARWALELQQFTSDIEYRKGKHNVVADTISRQSYERFATVVTPTNAFPWIEDLMQKIRNDSKKFQDYTIQNNNIYRHISHQYNGLYEVVRTNCMSPPGKSQPTHRRRH